MRRPLLHSVAGFALGLLCLWLAFRTTDLDEVLTTLDGAKGSFVIAAVGAYWLNLGVRVARWHLLLNAVTRLAMRDVATALVVGYALNNVLPARLGELYRADFLGRQYGVSRSSALGTIFVERLGDGLALVTMLIVALLFLPVASAEMEWLLDAIAIVSGAAVLVALSASWRISDVIGIIPARWSWAQPRLQKFALAVSVVRRRSILSVLCLTVVIYAFEALAVAATLAAVDVEATWAIALAVVGVASLSTLVPTAPAYVGSLQLAYVVSLGVVGVASANAIAAATVFQLFLLSSVSVLGLGILLLVSSRQIVKRLD